MSDYRIIKGDCLDVMQQLIDEGVKVDAIITDPPYGTTACKWDSVIPFEPMWALLKQLRSDITPIILFNQEPFGSSLRMSNIKEYKYDWIWEKSNPSNIAMSNKQPMRYHELLSVFYVKQCLYNKQMIERSEGGKKRLSNKNNPIRFSGTDLQGDKGLKKDYDIDRYNENLKNPSTILKFKSERGKKHPTQKPVALLEYLIKTYTNEGDTVLDFTMGSGSTGVACVNTNRNFIGIELDDKYFDIANERIKQAKEEE